MIHLSDVAHLKKLIYVIQIHVVLMLYVIPDTIIPVKKDQSVLAQLGTLAMLYQVVAEENVSLALIVHLTVLALITIV